MAHKCAVQNLQLQLNHSLPSPTFIRRSRRPLPRATRARRKRTGVGTDEEFFDVPEPAAGGTLTSVMTAAKRDRAELKPAEHPSNLVQLPAPTYSTRLGSMFCGDSTQLLRSMPDNSVDLVCTSPPYALHFKKAYGNVAKSDYVNWFRTFGEQIFRVLKPTGSFVLNIGGSYNAGSATRSLYQFRVLLMLCDELGFNLAQECFWFNPAKLPAPAEWVTVRRIRIKDSVEYVFWLSKTENPKANNRNVLVEYSPDMLRLIKRGYRAKDRPSGHKMTHKFQNDRGGAIPSNVIERGNNESNSAYIRATEKAKQKAHPARFPAALPEFFIKLLTDETDLIVDPFAGSNMTGATAERLNRRWLSFEILPEYARNSRLRFENLI
jgi:site-specific DNA-methyltransferase (cytosine-N4-specific)